MQKQVDDKVRPCHVRKLHTYQCDHHTGSHAVCNMAVGNAVEFEVVCRLKLPYSSFVVLYFVHLFPVQNIVSLQVKYPGLMQ